ncbi:DUF1566 domain-containing protein [Vibrio cidicii]|uniref:Lcl C-terminal domain-containing protein n=1 Tax=Vibrio cidicii TaxID=1763883 RepID=UPI0037503630
MLTAAGGFATPTIEQLSSLVYCSSRVGDKYGQSQYGQCTGSYTKPAINSIAFPDTLLSRTYWSSDPYEGHSSHAWRTYFENGFVDWNSRSEGLYVRLVRAGQVMEFEPLTVTKPTGGSVAGGGGAIACSATENTCSTLVRKNVEITLTATPETGYAI